MAALLRLKLTALALGLSGMLCANTSPHWQLESTNEGWKSETLALKYFHNSELQRQWAWHLLGKYRFGGNEHILDFGCGDGKISAELSHFVPEGSVRGIDMSASMIDVAGCCFPSVHYPNLTFAQTSDVDCSRPGNNKYDLICSFCVFHLVPNPEEVLKNLRSCLSDDGHLLLIIPSGNSPAFFQAANETFEKYGLTAPWGKQAKGSSEDMRSVTRCRATLAAAGFDVASIVELHTPTAFYNRQQLVDWMLGTVAANWRVPMEVANSFFEEVVDRMADLDEEVVQPSGAYYLKLSRLEVVAKPSR